MSLPDAWDRAHENPVLRAATITSIVVGAAIGIGYLHVVGRHGDARRASRYVGPVVRGVWARETSRAINARLAAVEVDG